MGLKSFSKKQIILLVTLLLIVIAIPVTLYLSQKTQIFKPRAQELQGQTHSVINFDPKVEQILSPGDTLEGKGIPNAKVSVSITPDGATGEVTADKDGKWSYQIPQTLQPKNYNLTIILEDIAGNIASIKTYRIVIHSPASSSFNFIKPAYAQGDTSTPSCPLFTNYCPGIGCIFFLQQCQPPSPSPIPGPTCSKNSQTCVTDDNCKDGTASCQQYRCIPDSTQITGVCRYDPNYTLPTPTPPPPPRELEPLGSEYSDWVARMKRLSIYPAKDIRTKEIVFVSREEFQEQVCNNDPSCISPRYDEFIDGIKHHNFQYIIALGNKLREAPGCYVAFETLQPYFGDANDFFEGERLNLFSTANFPSLSYMYQNPQGCQESQIKHQIDENTLAGFIHQTAGQYSQDQDDPNHDFFTTTETASLGFLPVSTFLKLYALNDGYKGDTGLVADTAFAVTNFIPLAKVGGAVKQIGKVGNHVITSRTVLDLKEATPNMRTIRQAIESKTGSGLRKGERVSQEAVQSQIDTAIERNFEDLPIRHLTNVSRALSLLPRIYPNEDRELWELIVRTAAQNLAKPYDRQFLGQLTEELISGIRKPGILRDIEIPNSVIEDLRGLVNRDWAIEIEPEAWSRFAGEFHENTFGLNQGRTIMFPNDRRAGADTVTHESIHRLSHLYGNGENRHLVWIERGGEHYAAIVNFIWEWGTEELKASIRSGDNGYAKVFPKWNRSLWDLTFNLSKNVSGGRLTMADIRTFAITKDDSALLRKIFGVDDPHLLEQYFDGKINFNAVQRIYIGNLFKQFVPEITRSDVTLASLGMTGLIAGSITGSSPGDIMTRDPILRADESILTPEFEDSLREVDIDAPDQAQAGQTIRVKVLETEGGVVPSTDQLKEVFELQPVAQSGLIKTAYALVSHKSISEIHPLQATEGPPNTYTITIPASEVPGRYNLVAYMYRENSDPILASASEAITITSVTTTPTPTSTPTGTSQKTITSILINNQPVVDISNPEATITLPRLQLGVPGLSYVPVQIYYSDGTNRYLTLTFNYLNYTSPRGGIPSPTPTLSPLATPTPSSLAFGGCRLTADGSSTAGSYVGSGTLFVMTQVPAGAASASWGGTNTIGGVTISIPVVDMDYFLRSLNSSTFTKYIGPYQDSDIGTYIRYITVFDSSGGTICQSNPVTIFVIARSSGGTTYPTPPTGGGSYTYPTPSPGSYTVCTFGNCSPTPTPSPTPSCLSGGSRCDINNQRACCSNQCTGAVGSATCSYPFR